MKTMIEISMATFEDKGIKGVNYHEEDHSSLHDSCKSSRIISQLHALLNNCYL